MSACLPPLASSEVPSSGRVAVTVAAAATVGPHAGEAAEKC